MTTSGSTSATTFFIHFLTSGLSMSIIFGCSSG